MCNCFLSRYRYLQKNGTHHCPGVNKYLVVNYTCIPDSKGVVLCDSEESLLECKAGWKIDITDAFWGRRANSKYCPTGMQEMECDNGPSAKANLKKKCDGQSSCIVKATSDELEDKKTVCPGNLLYLLLNYACRSSSTKGMYKSMGLATKLLFLFCFCKSTSFKRNNNVARTSLVLI